MSSIKFQFPVIYLLLFISPLLAATYYVAKDGSGNYSSIQAAADAVGPGDKVIIKAGKYNEKVTIKTSGTSGNPIVFEGEGGPKSEWLTIVDASQRITGWQSYQQSTQSHSYRIKTSTIESKIGYKPGIMLLGDKMLGWVKENSDHGMDKGDGFDLFKSGADDKKIIAEFQGGSAKIFDVVFAVWGNKNDGYTYINFRDGANPDNLDVRAAAKNSGTFDLSGRSYVTIRNLKVQGGHYQIKLVGSTTHDNTIEDNFLINGTSRILIENGAYDNMIKGNEITGNLHAIEAGVMNTAKEVLYVFGKRWSSFGGSDDRFFDMKDAGANNQFAYNHMYNSQAGPYLFGKPKGLKIYGNHIHGTVGSAFAIRPGTDVEIYDNLIYNCNIILRFHEVDTWDSSTRFFIYRNRFFNPDGKGTLIWVHTQSSFRNTTPKGYYYVYHNSFSGSKKGVGFNGNTLHGLPNSFWINNIFSSNKMIGESPQGTYESGAIGAFDYNWHSGTFNRGIPPWYGSHNINSQGNKIWDESNLPDFTIFNSEVRNAGIDLSQQQTIQGKSIGPLPGMEPGYFSGSAPDMGWYSPGPIPLKISPPFSLAVEVGQPYSYALKANGGISPYGWTKTSGSLPEGLSLSAAGVISGAPVKAEQTTGTIKVTDADNKTDSQTFTITIVPTKELSIVSSSLANGMVDESYSFTLQAMWGKEPYSWSKVGTLPGGLSLSSAGVMSGTPVKEEKAVFTVTVTDADGKIASKICSLSILPRPVAPGAYGVVKAEGNIIIDGDFQEYSNANAIQFPNNYPIVTVKLLWDETNIYLAYDVKDVQLNAIVEEDQTGGIWNDDAVELFFDVNNDKGTSMQSDDRQYIINIKKAFYNNGDATGINHAIVLNGTIDNNTDTDTGYKVEIKIPWNTLGVTTSPAEGLRLGANFAVDDRDGSGERESMDWMRVNGSFLVPENWGEIELVGEAGAIVSEQTSVFNAGKLTLKIYPNPFRPKTNIQFSLPNQEYVEIKVYDLQGRVVRTLLQGAQEVGQYHIVWEGKDENNLVVSNGVYLIRLVTTRNVKETKVILLR